MYNYLMWTCEECSRIFKKAKQPHSCQKVTIESHFANKELAKELFDYLLNRIENNIGQCKIISLPCCIHLFGNYDFLAALPKKDRIESRFVLDRELKNPRLKVAVPISSKAFKNCFDIYNKQEINDEFMSWIK